MQGRSGVLFFILGPLKEGKDERRRRGRSTVDYLWYSYQSIMAMC